MVLRKYHPDGHWCNALEKNIKGFIREFDDQIMADLQRLSDLRSEMERLLKVMSKMPSESNAIDDAHSHSSSERAAEQLTLKVGHLATLAFKDRTISASDLKGWLSNEASVRIARLSDDTKQVQGARRRARGAHFDQCAPEWACAGPSERCASCT
jgi:hypothetical protein